jgi:hypothetical protein
MLADAEVKVAPGAIFGGEVSRSVEGQAGFGRGGEVRRAADQPRHVFRYSIEDFS